MGSGIEEVETGALKLYCHTGLWYWSADLVLEGELLPPFSVSLVSMTMTTRRMLLTVEAGGSPQQPLVGDGTLMGGEVEGKAQSH